MHALPLKKRYFLVTLCLCFKTSLPAKPFFNEKEFDIHENEHVDGTHFHVNGFAQRLVLTQRHTQNCKKL